MIETRGWPRRKRCIAVMIGVVLCGITGQKLRAEEISFGAGYTVEHSSNIMRVPANGQEEWIHGLIVGAGYRDIGPELAAQFTAQAQRLHYQRQTFVDETLYFLDASALWTISPQLFTWSFADHHSQIVRDARLADTPLNRVSANVFETGPDVYLRVDAGNIIDLGARYGNVNFGDSGGNNDRVSAYLRWLYDLDATTTTSLNYEQLKVVFRDDVANINYTRTEAFARLETRPAPSHFAVDVGRTKVDRQRGPGLDAPLWRLWWLYLITSESTFGVTLARDHEDAGLALRASVADPTAAANAPAPLAVQPVATSDVFTARRAEAFYTYAAVDWAAQLRVFNREYKYQLTPQDREERGGYVELAHDPGGLITTTLFGALRKTKLLNISREDTDNTIGLRWLYHASRTLSFLLEGTRSQRSSTDPNSEYTDQRVFLGVFYSSGPNYQAVRR